MFAQSRKTRLSPARPAPPPRPECRALTTRLEADRAAPISSAHGFDFSRIPAGATPIQRKPTVSVPGDSFEREADDVADKVMRMADSSSIGAMPAGIQRKCAACEDEEKTSIHAKHATSANAETTLDTGAAVSATEHGGAPLPGVVRSYFEPRFGQDFSHVRVHADAIAANAARSIQARAYTIGRDIVFGAGQFAPATAAGKRLLAHELTHVVQQTRAPTQEMPIAREPDHTPPLAWGSGWFPSQGGTIPGQKPPAPPKSDPKPKAPPPWSADVLKKMLDACDGGLGIWAKAKKANKGKDPPIVPGSGGSTDTATGTITLDTSQDDCTNVQVLIQELSNLSRKADFDTLDDSARAGDVNRADYIKRTEKIEYETGVKNDLTAFDACKGTWKCTTAQKEWARKAKNFDDYFSKFLSARHKEGYGKWWDDNCKAAFDKKHARK